MDFSGYLYNIVQTRSMISPSESGNQRGNISIGCEVAIVEKHNQRTGELTEGVVQRILTKSSSHPHGIKVMLETGEVGRVKEIYED